MTERETTTIYGRIAWHDEPPFWGLITIDRASGFIVGVERGRVFGADHAFVKPGQLIFPGFGDIAPGYIGSLTVLDTGRPTTVSRDTLKTKVGWSPLENQTFPGALEAVFSEGKRLY